MDRFAKWHAHIADVKTLFSYWEARRLAGEPLNRRTREILTILLFTLCLENNEDKRFLIGFQRLGLGLKPSLIRDLFEDGFGEIEDTDVILIPDLGPNGPDVRDIHRCQLVSYRGRPVPGTTEDLIAFIEEKKLRIPRDDDLRLIIHLEQPTAFDWVKLSVHFQTRRPKCAYSQVFLMADTGIPEAPRWSCRQLYPRLLSKTRTSNQRGLCLQTERWSAARTNLERAADSSRLFRCPIHGQLDRACQPASDAMPAKTAPIQFVVLSLATGVRAFQLGL